MPDPTGRVSHLPHFHRGVAWKEPVRVATTANITISTALNAGDSIDGVTLVAGDRVLVKDQSTGNQNGIYVVGASPSRAYDMDQDGTTTVRAEEIAGAFVYVIAGTANAGKVFHTTNVAGGTLGSTTITWTELSGSGGVTVQDEGTPLSTTATTLNFTGAGITATGSGATKTINAPGVAGDPIYDAKGDLPAGTGADAASKLAVGSNGQVLTADSTQATGIKWATPASAGVATDTIWDAKGDLAAGTGSDTAARLAVGSNDQVLVADSAQSTGMKWASVSTVDPEGWTSIIASADEDVTNAQNQDHSQFQISVTAGKHYMVELLMLTSGNNTTGDFEFRFVVTAGDMDGRGHLLSFDGGNAAVFSGFAFIATSTGGNNTVGVQGDLGFYNSVRWTMTFRQNTSSGTFKLQFGNAAAAAGRTSRVAKGSILRWRQTD